MLLGLLAAPAQDSAVLRAFAADEGVIGDAALKLARHAFDTYCLTRRRISVPDGLPPVFSLRSGVFVSAMVNGAPRCCMGSLYPTKPTLAEEILAAAAAAAGLDYRFRPIRPEELSRLRLIVSVVGEPQAIADVSRIDPVRDGIVARLGTQIGVTLPGETMHLDRAIRWARIRAGVKDGTRVEYFLLPAVRVVEPATQAASSQVRGASQ
jgi:AMMECR1 domain-containing protein